MLEAGGVAANIMTAPVKKIRGKVGNPAIEIDPTAVEVLAGRGMLMKDIALCLGINLSTLYNHKSKFKELEEAVERGKAKGIAYVTEKFMKHVDQNNLDAQKFYLTRKAGWKEELDITIAPRPTIIERPNGTEVELGTTHVLEDDQD